MSMRASPIKSVVFGSTGIVGETITILLSKNADTEEESKPFIVAGMRLELETHAPEELNSRCTYTIYEEIILLW